MYTHKNYTHSQNFDWCNHYFVAIFGAIIAHNTVRHSRWIGDIELDILLSFRIVGLIYQIRLTNSGRRVGCRSRIESFLRSANLNNSNVRHFDRFARFFAPVTQRVLVSKVNFRMLRRINLKIRTFVIRLYKYTSLNKN